MQRNIISQRKWANKQERGDIMAAFPEEWLNELLSKTDIVRVVGDYVSLTPKGGRFWGCCPFHNEKTPSFSVTPEKQMYYCFGCHAGGGAIHFVIEAVKLLAQRAGMELPDEVNDARLRAERAYKERLYNACKEAAIFYNKKLLSAEGKAAQEYLKRRGIGGKMAVRFGLGYAPEGWHNLMDYLEQKGYSRKEMVDAGLAIASKKDGGAYDAYRGRLIYPIISATGRVMAFGARTMKKDDEPKYINTGDTPIYNKRYNLYALNMQRGKRVGELIMVEGYMDVISLFAAGIENAVASLGTAMTQQQARLIKRYADKMYLCYDGDSAGQAATLRGLDILSAEGIDPKVIVIPGNMDPDDAADIVRDLSYERAETLLRLMGVEDATEIRRLLGYKDGTAGGMMTTQFVSVADTDTVGHAIEVLRELPEDHPSVHFVYVLDEYDKLVGVCSLRTLVLTDDKTPMSKCMYDDLITQRRMKPKRTSPPTSSSTT